MDERREAYCVMSPVFYDAMHSVQTAGAPFPTADRPRSCCSASPSTPPTGTAESWSPIYLVTIYPVDDAARATILAELGKVLDGEPGRYILTDLRWGTARCTSGTAPTWCPAPCRRGEWQLIALVRAYLSPAPAVVLDEATCYLDAAAERHAEEAFAARGGTLVVIAHRLSPARCSATTARPPPAPGTCRPCRQIQPRQIQPECSAMRMASRRVRAPVFVTTRAR